MITRLVRLCFNDNYIEDFKELFENVSSEIKDQPGCNSANLLQDVNRPNIFFTKSLWDSEEQLNNYRDTEVFRSIWETIKPNFIEKPQAWSTQEC